MSADKKKDFIAQMLATLQKTLGKEEVQLLAEDGAASEVREVIRTGLDVVDYYVIGVGGLPVGRMTEIYSEEGGGKTSFAMGCVAGAQKAGGAAIWCETEEALQLERFATFGADASKVLLMQPKHLEEFGSHAHAALMTIPEGVGPNILVWDSIAATPTKAELEGELDEDVKDRVGARAKEIGKICKLLCPLAVEKRCALLFINQVREKIGVMFGDKYTTPGGRAVKFHSSVRLQILGGTAVKSKEEHVGKDPIIMAAKNKLAPPWRKSRVRLSYASGWDNEWSTLNHAKDKELVEDRAIGAKAYAEAVEKLGWIK